VESKKNKNTISDFDSTLDSFEPATREKRSTKKRAFEEEKTDTSPHHRKRKRKRSRERSRTRKRRRR